MDERLFIYLHRLCKELRNEGMSYGEEMCSYLMLFRLGWNTADLRFALRTTSVWTVVIYNIR